VERQAIRPRTLEPIDYTKENFTRALWFSEGVTSTAEEIIQLRAGLLDEKQFLARLGQQISELEDRPAHLTQSRRNRASTCGLRDSITTAAPSAASLLQQRGVARIYARPCYSRRKSRPRLVARTLSWMNANYARKGRFFDDSNGVREAAGAVSHSDLGWFFTKYVAGREELPWNEFLRFVGLHVEQFSITIPDTGFIASRNFDGPCRSLRLRPQRSRARRTHGWRYHH